ncbi:glycosyltransferase family 39 protein [Candidatus Woesearchaeota archaeon]|nr:glycosyltransferase family 39 protein [Candidatus Woesearchaeota archaeon]
MAKHVQSESHDDDQEIKLDFSSVKRFLSDKRKVSILLTLLFILVPVVFTFQIRLAPEDLPQTEAWAANAVGNYFRGQIAAVVNQQYPSLPQANKDMLINQQYEEFLKNNQQMIDQQIAGTSQQFKKGFQYDENNVTYTFLGDLDSYFYLRQARNLFETGSVCDEVKDGWCWDNHILAPLGGSVMPSMHPYGIVFLYKVIHAVNPKINLMKASFLLPTVLAAIAAVAAFFIGRRLMNEVAGFFAAMFVTLNPMFITRTLGSDTDIWNVVLALVIVWVFLEAIEAEGLKMKSILAALAGLVTGVFAFAWGGWWYIFEFLLAAVVAYFIIVIAKNLLEHRDIKKVWHHSELRLNAFTAGIYFFSSFVFVSLMTSVQAFTAVVLAPLSTFTTLKTPVHPNLWPNVFTTVAELNEANLSTIVSQTSFGVTWLFALALIGIIFLMIKRKPDVKEYALIGASTLLFLYLVSANAYALNPFVYVVILMLPVLAALGLYVWDKHSKIDIKPAVLFTVWFMGMIIASIKGVRFILLLTPVFSIAVGIAIGYLYQYLARILRQEMNLNKTLANLIVFFVLFLLLLTPIRAGESAGDNFTPSITKGWWDSLTKIRTESAPDAIINSWWDFGHWFKYVADRRVTLDGVTQDHPNAHWLGLILQTDNEREALGILRMLDCGSNNAFDEVDKRNNDTEVSENIISELVVMDEAEGAAHLKELGYTDSEIQTISSYLYCNPPEDYFITSADMVGKAGVWAHFGLWNFDRAYMVKNVRPKPLSEAVDLLQQRFGYSIDEATSIYYEMQSLQTERAINDWVSPWPSYLTNDWVGCQEQNQTEIVPVSDDTGADDVSADAQNESNASISAAPKTKTVVVSRKLMCGVGRTLGQDANGRTVLEGIIVDYDKPDNSSLIISSFDNNGVRRGSGEVAPASFILLGEDDYETIEMANSTFEFDVLIDQVNNRALIADPYLSKSMFTKLFYLDGRYTEHFQKFSDLSDVTGSRIIVWKVDWPW